MGKIGDLLKRGASECWQFAREVKASAIGEEAARRISKRLFESSRAEILEELQMLPDEEDRRTLRRRLWEAEQEGKEDQIIVCLSGIPPQKLGNTLARLARMSDAEFLQDIEVLHHNPIAQWCTRQKVKARKTLKEAATPLKKGAEASGTRIAGMLRGEVAAANKVFNGLRASTATRKENIARMKENRNQRRQRHIHRHPEERAETGEVSS